MAAALAIIDRARKCRGKDLAASVPALQVALRGGVGQSCPASWELRSRSSPPAAPPWEAVGLRARDRLPLPTFFFFLPTLTRRAAPRCAGGPQGEWRSLGRLRGACLTQSLADTAAALAEAFEGEQRAWEAAATAFECPGRALLAPPPPFTRGFLHRGWAGERADSQSVPLHWTILL